MTRRLSGGTPDRFRLVDFIEERRDRVGVLGIFASEARREPPWSSSPEHDPDEPAPIGEPPPPIPVPNPEPPPMQL